MMSTYYELHKEAMKAQAAAWSKNNPKANRAKALRHLHKKKKLQKDKTTTQG